MVTLPLKVDELILVEIITGSEWSYGLYRILEIKAEDELICRKFWWTSGTNPMWNEWLSEQTIEQINSKKVIANRIRLNKGKLNGKLVKRLNDTFA